jgi:peptide/nickel transport system substrate-binding protein
MNTNINSTNLLSLIIMLALVLGACQSETTPETIIETLVVTEIIQGTPVEVILVVTPTPEPGGPRTLVICQGLDPGTLYDYNTDHMSTFHILEAIYDGPIDKNSYSYQPVILEKLPNLADGDATLSAVTVSEGDLVVDANGEVVTLHSFDCLRLSLCLQFANRPRHREAWKI